MDKKQISIYIDEETAVKVAELIYNELGPCMCSKLDFKLRDVMDRLLSEFGKDTRGFGL